jgi:hypothetical protein
MNYKYCKHHDIDTIENPEFFSIVKNLKYKKIKCLLCHRESQKKYLSKPGMDQINKERRKIRRENPEQKLKARIRKLRFMKNRRLHILQYNRTYENNRKQHDPSYKLIKNLRSRLWAVLKKNQKSESTIKLTGCTLEQLKKHLENKFEDGMDWNNYGVWHVDHIIPCANFDLSKPEQQKICFHYTNLQPLWGEKNMQKGARLI